MKRITLLTVVFLPLFLAGQQPIIIDHICLDLDQIPDEYIDSAKANLWIGYGHTSHGSQLTSGMDAMEDYFTDGTYDWSLNGGSGELHLDDGGSGYLTGDLGNAEWHNLTRTYLGNYPGCNVIIWSWCGQVSTVDLQSHYLGPMEQLESEYPDVQFVYMTGHLEGEGIGGSLQLANQQIRDYCTANNKILYDFADIEKLSPDADTNYQEYYATDGCVYNPPVGGSANWANNWLSANSAHELTQISQLCTSCAHSVSLNCTKKGIATWFLWARLSGWESGPTSDPNTNLIISEIADPANAEQSKYVELYNNSDETIDFNTTTWYLARQAETGTWANTELTGSIDAGETYVVSFNTDAFLTSYGFNADINSSVASGDGDDGYFLYYGGDNLSGILIDTYGEIGVDGSGEAWEYLDAKAVRVYNTAAPNPVWTQGEWYISSTANDIDMTPDWHHKAIDWTGSVDTDWNTVGNWNEDGSVSSFLPDAGTMVTISTSANITEVTGEASCGSLDLSGTGLLEVLQGSILNVGGNLSSTGTN